MPLYFADTWYFIARLDRTDRDFERARRLSDRYHESDLVTHDGVLMELLAFFSAQGAVARQNAAYAVRQLVLSIEVVPNDRQMFTAALGLYERRPDKEYSLVDCMSMVVMRERGITHVLTNDHHFRQERFTVLSGAP